MNLIHPTPSIRTPVVLSADNQQIFGVAHRPAVCTTRCPAVAIFHGLVASKDQPHQIFVKLSEALAQAGIASLRIDLRGRGDSQGNMAVDVTPQGDLQDASLALDWLEAQPYIDPQRLGVMGLSWGGSLAAVIAGRQERVSAAALWNASLSMHQWVPTYQEIDGRQVVELWGNLIGQQFFAGLQTFRPLDEIQQARGPILILQSEKDETNPDPLANAHTLASALKSTRIQHEVFILLGADHALMHYEWERQAIVHTVEWLAKTFQPES